ncbi:MAG: M35 family metallo-endopeptidase, partial [Micromonosporaceae bacterium]
MQDLKAREHLGWESMGDVGPGTMGWLDSNICPCPRTGAAPACCPSCAGPNPPNPPTPPNPPAPPCPPCTASAPRPVGCPPCPATDHIEDCEPADLTSVAAARAAALTELDATITAAAVRPLPVTVAQAMWRAFRTDTVTDADDVVAKLRAIRSGLPGVTVECEGAHWLFCPDASALGYTRPVSHLFGHGSIHVCTPGWQGMTAEQQAETLIHEGSHRFNGTNDDAGYFSLEGEESAQTAGTSRSLRLNNADSYTALCIYLTRKPAADVESKGEAYRGNQLGVVQAPTGPIALPGDPAAPRFQVTGNPPNSAFTFRWVIADPQDRRY